jgi:hypothetical protein
MFVQQPDAATEPDYKYITKADLAAYELWCAPHVAAFNPIPSGSKISVNDLLRTHGYPPSARLIEIPYRVV